MKRTRARAAAILVCLSLSAASALVADRSDASVSIAVSWQDLVGRSTAVAFVTPVDATSVWENGRIFTYTRVRVDRAVAGATATGSEARVRTMGGIVGDVGQQVEGEAVLTPGRSSLLFLHALSTGGFDVTERGQGQFPVVADDPTSPPRVVRSRAAGRLLDPKIPSPLALPTLAADVLHGLSLDDAAQKISAAWQQSHAH